ncbi:MAG TPA: DUF4384 domain-containing protein [Pyrinomonadaceae bacterium]|nr:DUF4384 domain-containing protein [Pyrinomonadaceae bacterium]
MKVIRSIGIIGCLLFLIIPPTASSQQPNTEQQGEDQDEGSRQIVLEEFTRARPASSSARIPTPAAGRRRPTVTALSRRRYRRKSPPLVAALKGLPLTTAEIGVTIWRLRPSDAMDGGARVLVMEGGQPSQLTPERVEADQLLRLGDRVRISVESPRAGYLYVVDREQYGNGALGDAMLIFPTTQTRGGDNRVRPGVLVDIPAQDDSPPYFTLRSNNPGYVGEMLMLIVVPQPIEGLAVGPQPIPLPLAEVLTWQKLWGTQAELFDMVGGAGTAWTQAEKAASLARGGRMLTQDEPGPQNIYRVALHQGNGFMINVPLRCRR